MSLLDISLQYRVIVGISAMVFLFTSFLIAFISNQRKKLKYHKDVQAMHEEQQQKLKQQNSLLEQRVEQRTAELLHQKEILENTLTDLRASQSQLVQREKMASLGELTAGIAHEIQNPLNFVNNFAEVNVELLAEMQEQLISANVSGEAMENIDLIVKDIIQNLERVSQHGKRAESIVKNMLQHSRNSTGDKQLTDINALADEYLKLSYHGFRAKDKTFNATLKMEYDQSIDKINIIPQDIGRVLLNIYNNAFYSVNEKRKSLFSGNEKVAWEPGVSVITRATEGSVELIIRDNGLGISDKFIKKIYQPFFTTKPTGEGTGLGLSLSYDIIKAHGGDLKVDSKDGEFAQFTFVLPR